MTSPQKYLTIDQLHSADDPDAQAESEEEQVRAEHEAYLAENDLEE